MTNALIGIIAVVLLASPALADETTDQTKTEGPQTMTADELDETTAGVTSDDTNSTRRDFNFGAYSVIWDGSHYVIQWN